MGGLGRRRPQKITSGKTTKIMQKVGNYFISIQKRAKHTLPDLPFEYHELEPVVSAEIMKLHHQKHHQKHPEPEPNRSKIFALFAPASV